MREPPACTCARFQPYANRDSGVASSNGVIVWAGFFAGIAVLSASGEVTGEIVGDHGSLFDDSPNLGRLCFYRDQLVVVEDRGNLVFYSLAPAL